MWQGIALHIVNGEVHLNRKAEYRGRRYLEELHGEEAFQANAIERHPSAGSMHTLARPFRNGLLV